MQFCMFIDSHSDIIDKSKNISLGSFVDHLLKFEFMFSDSLDFELPS